jgi:DNA polymerase/3'-5' exonuclease PolX
MEVEMDNFTIAEHLIRMAHNLEGQCSNLYRVRAYRRAAETILNLDRPLEDLVGSSGPEALRELPGIGASLGGKIVQLIETGDFVSCPDQALVPAG